MPNHRICRRTFLSRAAVALAIGPALPCIVPGLARSAETPVAPNNRINVGFIGVGNRGQQVLQHFLNQPECRVVSICDVKKDVLAQAKQTVDRRYQGTDCVALGDFRELVSRADIDAVCIASTDNWHVLHALAAARAGKDVYLEKPLALSLGESQLLRQELLKRKRVFQFGTQQRSDRKFRLACELVRNGCIGTLKQINIWSPGSRSGGSSVQVPPPPELDYPLWLGPAPERPYTEGLADSSTWFHVSDFALGFIAGWGIHPMDIALWGAGSLVKDQVEVSATGTFPNAGICDTATDWEANFRFKNGLTMRFDGGAAGKFKQFKEWTSRYGQIIAHGTAFEGSNGWIHVNRQRITMRPEDLIDLDPDDFKTKLVRSPDHVKSFLAAVRSRGHTVSPIEAAVLADVFCHLPNIAMRTKRELTYDVEREKFIGDAEANRRLQVRKMRTPWDRFV